LHVERRSPNLASHVELPELGGEVVEGVRREPGEDVGEQFDLLLRCQLALLLGQAPGCRGDAVALVSAPFELPLGGLVEHVDQVTELLVLVPGAHQNPRIVVEATAHEPGHEDVFFLLEVAVVGEGPKTMHESLEITRDERVLRVQGVRVGIQRFGQPED
jgi:hypothetical protein